MEHRRDAGDQGRAQPADALIRGARSSNDMLEQFAAGRFRENVRPVVVVMSAPCVLEMAEESNQNHEGQRHAEQ